MSRTLDARRSLAALTALVVAVVGATALPAAADPGNGGNGNGHSQSDKAKKAHKAKPAHAPKDKSDKAPKAPKAPKEPKAPKAPKEPKAPKPPQGAGHGSQGGGHGSQGGGHNPGGNNGTIKIDGLEFDTAPNNEPHPGCRFQVDFYGFDEGDLYADVTFEAHSPTTRSSGSNVLLTDSVFIGEDDASGGGSEAGLDAQVEYTLDFTGITPHPKQGYHVKLTIHADGSKGADTKHKVFWVQPCAAGDTPGGDTPGGGTPGGGTPGGGTPGGGTPGGDTPGGDTPGGDTPGDTEVLGEQASSGGSSDTEVMGAQASAGQDVPTAVDAGEEGNFVQDVVRSPIPLLIIGLGALLATIAVVSRRRNSSI